MARHERLSGFGPMNARVVQHHHDLPLDLTQQMLEKPAHVPTANGPGPGVLEESTVRGDGPNRRELLPVRRERDQGRDAPGRPRPPPHAFEREPDLIQVHQRHALSDLFFPIPAGRVLARRQSGVHCAQPRVRLAFEA